MIMPRFRRFIPMLLAAMLAVATVGMLGGAGVASAATAGRGTFVCAGTFKSPGVLTGWHRSVVVRGVCEVNAGRAYVRGDLSVAAGGALLALFALNDRTGHGHSSLSVGGNVFVYRGGAAVLGCGAADFPCVDDPNQKNPTLISSDTIGASLIVTQALGVVVHESRINGSVLQSGGGGGLTCTPSGIFAQFKSPVYSDYSSNSIGGNLIVTGLRSCWFGTLMTRVRGNVYVAGNTMADPDAMEVNSDFILGNMWCSGNSPAIQFGDSMGVPNRVGRMATGQCGFNVLKPNPAPTGPLEHISVHAF